MNFTAIDFETANPARSSACSVGLIVVQDGKVVERFYSLIKPPTDDFSPFNVRRHRIRPEMVAAAPTFADVYPSLVEHIRGPVIAHNASFDISVLRACVDEYGIAAPKLDYYCSLRLSQAQWPDAPSHQLTSLAQLFGIPLVNHHNAQEDASACAHIVLRALHDQGLVSVKALASCLGVTKGRLAIDSHTPCRSRVRNRGSGNEMPVQDERPAVQSTRLSGDVFLFTGLLDSMPRDEAERRIRALGGATVANVSGRVTIIVVGHEPGSKLSQAEARRRAGQPIRMLNEAEFLSLLEGTAHEEC